VACNHSTNPSAATPNAPDGARYSHMPHLDITHAERTGIKRMRITGYDSDGLVQVERRADEPDALILLARGSGRKIDAMIGGSRYRTCGFRDLRVAFVPEAAGVKMDYHAGARNLNLMFPKGALGASVAHHPRAVFAPVLFWQDPVLIALIARLELEMVIPSAASEMVTDGIVQQLACMLAGLSPHDLDPCRAHISIAPMRLRRVIEYVETNLDQPLRLADLAAIAGISQFHFARAFRDATGTSPYQHVCTQRLARAQRLLLLPDQPIGMIAAQCGYPRHSSFTSAFARAHRMSPREYRARFAFA